MKFLLFLLVFLLIDVSLADDGVPAKLYIIKFYATNYCDCGTIKKEEKKMEFTDRTIAKGTNYVLACAIIVRYRALVARTKSGDEMFIGKPELMETVKFFNVTNAIPFESVQFKFE